LQFVEQGDDLCVLLSTFPKADPGVDHDSFFLDTAAPGTAYRGVQFSSDRCDQIF
jgi:hypothetical protein